MTRKLSVSGDINVQADQFEETYGDLLQVEVDDLMHREIQADDLATFVGAPDGERPRVRRTKDRSQRPLAALGKRGKK
jgi:hypothetical protein